MKTILLSLLQNNDLSQKSRFVDPNSTQNTLNGMNAANGQNYQRNANTNGGMSNLEYNTLNTNGNQANNTLVGNNFNNNYSESNQMFEKIMSEVIHVSAFEQRGNLNNDVSSHPVQDMPLKIKGLLEPTKQHLTLPEGVPAPVTVLSAQPPFTSDIHLINSVALDAQRCIDSFCLNVPENVAFDFNPVA